jgi:hypothetical protein
VVGANTGGKELHVVFHKLGANQKIRKSDDMAKAVGSLASKAM